MGKDYYKTLEIDKNASQDEIKKAFRKKAHEFHPDKASGDEKKFKEANEAYQILGDANKRAQYDQFGSSFEQAQAGGGFHGFEGFRDFSGFTNGFNVDGDDLGDIFGGIGDIFGFGGGGQGRRQKRGHDIEVVLTIDFMEAVFGVEKEIGLKKNIVCDKCKGNGAEPGTPIETCKTCGGIGRVARVQRTILGNMQVQATCADCQGEGKIYAKKCSKCNGSGQVNEIAKIKIKIPAGINNGEAIRLANQGEAGGKGASAGDLYLKLRINPDKRFRRDGYDVFNKVIIGFSEAALGGKVDIETVDGVIKLKVPEGTQSGMEFNLRNHGIPKLRGRGKGDHIVEIIVKTPTKLSRKQKELLKEFGE